MSLTLKIAFLTEFLYRRDFSFSGNTLAVEEKDKLKRNQMALAEQNLSSKTAKHEIEGHSKNRYKLLSKISQTTMSSVYLAIDKSTGEKVILKFLANTYCTNSSMRKRFNREANLGKKINHPNVVQIRAKGLIKKRPFILIDYINGQTLDDLAKQKPLSNRQCVRYLIEAANGLDAIHSAGLVHRDIKPENLMVGKKGRLQITDLGLMTHYGTIVDKLTATGAIILSPLYASPEQARGQNVDWRSDIYSLGATFYYLVTGKHPFVGQSPVDTLLLHISAPLTPPSVHNPQLPQELCNVITRMLSKDPTERYANCKKLVQDLRAIKLKAPQDSGMTIKFQPQEPRRTQGLNTLLQAFFISLALVATMFLVRLF